MCVCVRVCSCCAGGVAAADDSTSSWSPERLQAGDLLDCLDTASHWCVAEVLKVLPEGAGIRVRYKGWGPRWDESLRYTSRRLAPLGSKNGRVGPSRMKQGEDLHIEEKVRRHSFSLFFCWGWAGVAVGVGVCCSALLRGFV